MSFIPPARRIALRSHCSPKIKSSPPTITRRTPSGREVSAGPSAATSAPSTSRAAPTPASEEGQSRAVPSASTIVSASTASTAQARKTAIARPTSAPLIDRSPLLAPLGRPGRSRCRRPLLSGVGWPPVRLAALALRGPEPQRAGQRQHARHPEVQALPQEMVGWVDAQRLLEDPKARVAGDVECEQPGGADPAMVPEPDERCGESEVPDQLSTWSGGQWSVCTPTSTG
jgi:hypothetical protein